MDIIIYQHNYLIPFVSECCWFMPIMVMGFLGSKGVGGWEERVGCTGRFVLFYFFLSIRPVPWFIMSGTVKVLLLPYTNNK